MVSHSLPCAILCILKLIITIQRFCAKVMEKDEESQGVVVHFDGWSSRYDELLHIRGGRLRHLTQEQLKKKTRIRKPKVCDCVSEVHVCITIHSLCVMCALCVCVCDVCVCTCVGS